MIESNEINIKILNENFDEDLIKQIDLENVYKIFSYLKRSGVYYVEDLFYNSLDLFLYPYEVFIKKFEHLKEVLGNEFVDKLGNDTSLIEIMYEDWFILVYHNVLKRMILFYIEISKETMNNFDKIFMNILK